MNAPLRPISVVVGLNRNGQGTATERHDQARPEAQPPTPAATLRHTPPIDIHEGPDGLVLEADLPGANERSLKVELEDNVLSIFAAVDVVAPEGARPIHEEYRTGEFFRSFILSDEVDRDRIAAELNDGVLKLHLPRAERAQARRIEVKTPTA